MKLNYQLLQYRGLKKNELKKMSQTHQTYQLTHRFLKF